MTFTIVILLLSLSKLTNTVETKKYIRSKRSMPKVTVSNGPFPLDQFLGLNEKINIDKEELKSHLCGYLPVYPRQRACDCTDNCFVTGTCCMDILWNKYGSIDLVDYKRLLIDRASDYKAYQCVTLFPWLDDLDGVLGYLLIVSCPPNTPGDLEKNCTDRHKESLTFSLPVLGHDNNTYRNEYCARCNHVYNYHLSNLLFYETQHRPFFSFTFDTNIMTMPCIVSSSKRIKNCSKKNENYELCHSYLNPVSIYRNFHCLKCNRNVEKLDAIEVHQREPISTTFAWSKLIVISKDTITSYAKERAIPIEIKSHTLCRKYPRESIIFEKNCDKNPMYDTCADKTNQYLVIQNIRPIIYENFLTYLNISENEFVTIDAILNVIQLNRSLSPKEVVRVLSFSTYEREIFREGNISFIISSSPSFLRNSSNHIDFYKIFPNNRICDQPVIYKETSVNFTRSCSILHDDITHKESSYLFLTTLDYDGITKKVVLCKDICRSNTITRRNLTNDLTVVSAFPKDQRVLPLITCPMRRASMMSEVLKIEIYVSYIGTSVSIVGYIIVIATYASYERFKTSAGMCTLALTSSLLIADSMYLIAGIFSITGIAHIFSLCQFTAIIFHFAMLMAQSWCIVIAYDLKKNITSFEVDMTSVKFKIYSIFTSIICLLIIAASIIMDLEGIVKIGYGEGGTCLPHKRLGLLYFYIAPTILSFSISTCFIFGILLKISIETNRSHNALQESRRAKINIILLAFKLVLILGISESIGFIQVLHADKESDAHIFNIIVGFMYTAARSLRGVSMALTYLCKKDIFVMYRISFNKISHFGKARRTKNKSVDSVVDTGEQ